MNRSILTLAATAALLVCAAGSAQASPTCYTMPVPAVPAVYDTVVTPAVTVTEFEFTHAQDGQGGGQGPANRWEADANWNAETNPQSVGWTATGASRVRVAEVEKTTTVLVSAEIPAGTVEECVNLPDGVSPVPVGGAEAPLGNLDPAVPAEEPAAAPVAPEPTAVPLANVGASVPVPAQDPQVALQKLPKELAYTGPADWALPAAGGLLALGVAAVAISRRLA